MAGPPSHRENRVFFERLESRTLLSAGPRFSPQFGRTDTFDIPTVHILRAEAPRAQSTYDPTLSTRMWDSRIAIIAEYNPTRARFGPEWHSGFPDLSRAGDESRGPREVQGIYGSEGGFGGVEQSGGREHPQLLRSGATGFEDPSAPGANSPDNAGLGPPQVQRWIAELAAYGSSGSGAVITVVIAPAKPLVIVRGNDVDLPPPANASAAPAPLPQLTSQPQTVTPGPQAAQSVTNAPPQAPTGSTSLVTAASAPVVPAGNGYPATAARISVEAAAVSRETATGGAASAPPGAKVGTFAIVVPPGIGTIGPVAAAAPVAATTGAIATATAWVRSAAVVVERAFAGSVPDAPEAATYLSPAAYNLMRLNPAALFNDPIARIIGESATLSAPGARASHARAWAITGAVVAADAIFVGYWHLDRRRKLRAARKRQTARLFSVGPTI